MTATATNLRFVMDQDGAVILDIAHNAIVSLNPTGGFVWNLLQQGRLVEDIVCELAAETGTDIAVVDRDVRAFMEHLMSKHLVTD